MAKRIWKGLRQIQGDRLTKSRNKRLARSTKRMAGDLLAAKQPLKAQASYLRNKQPNEKNLVGIMLLNKLGREAAKTGKPFHFVDPEREMGILKPYPARRQGARSTGANADAFGKMRENLRNQCAFFAELLKTRGETFTVIDVPGAAGVARLKVHFTRTQRGIERVIEGKTLGGASYRTINYRDAVWFDEQGHIHIESG